MNNYLSWTMDDLIREQKRIEQCPGNKNPAGSFQIYTKPAMKKLDKIAWAITSLLNGRTK
jgi:hypothetical protein